MAPQVPQLVKYVRLLNIITAVIQLAAGVGSLTEIFSLDIPATFIAFYVMAFALLLLCFECRFSSTDTFLRENFGFLYSFRGLGVYLLFIGLLDFGMAGGIFGYVAGASACFTAAVVLSASCCVSAAADASAINSSDPNTKLPTYGSSAFASSTATAKGQSTPQSVISPTAGAKKKAKQGK